MTEEKRVSDAITKMAVLAGVSRQMGAITRSTAVTQPALFRRKRTVLPPRKPKPKAEQQADIDREALRQKLRAEREARLRAIAVQAQREEVKRVERKAAIERSMRVARERAKQHEVPKHEKPMKPEPMPSFPTEVPPLTKKITGIGPGSPMYEHFTYWLRGMQPTKALVKQYLRTLRQAEKEASDA